MPIWYNYTAILPLNEQYDDDGSKDLFLIPINIPGIGQFEASAVGNQDQIELLRIATLNSDGNLTSKQMEAVNLIKAHLMAVLRITYDINIQEFRQGLTLLALGAKDVDGRPNLHVRIEVYATRAKIDGNNIANVFLATEGIRHLIILVGDAQDGGLPLQYRYLSLYKAFESEFKRGEKWSNLEGIFAVINAEFETRRNIKRSLKARFHELRDRCAHILDRSGNKLGLIGLPDRDVSDVHLLIPLLIRALAEHVNNKCPAIRINLKQ